MALFKIRHPASKGDNQSFQTYFLTYTVGHFPSANASGVCLFVCFFLLKEEQWFPLHEFFVGGSLGCFFNIP